MECLLIPILLYFLFRFYSWLGDPERLGVDLEAEITGVMSDGEWWYSPDISEAIDERYRKAGQKPLNIREGYIVSKLREMVKNDMVEARFGKEDEDGIRQIRYRLKTGGRRRSSRRPTRKLVLQPAQALRPNSLQLATLYRVVFFYLQQKRVSTITGSSYFFQKFKKTGWGQLLWPHPLWMLFPRPRYNFAYSCPVAETELGGSGDDLLGLCLRVQSLTRPCCLKRKPFGLLFTVAMFCDRNAFNVRAILPVFVFKLSSDPHPCRLSALNWLGAVISRSHETPEQH